LGSGTVSMRSISVLTPNRIGCRIRFVSEGAIKLWPNKYCVYRHWVRGELIYVGKGRGNRAFSITGSTGRNKKWEALVRDEVEIEVEIISWHDTSSDALWAEAGEIERSHPTTNRRKKPNMGKPFVAFVLRMPMKLYETLKALAVRERRSMNSMIVWILEGAMYGEQGNGVPSGHRGSDQQHESTSGDVNSGSDGLTAAGERVEGVSGERGRSETVAEKKRRAEEAQARVTQPAEQGDSQLCPEDGKAMKWNAKMNRWECECGFRLAG
jgi:hypothetical protein